MTSPIELAAGTIEYEDTGGESPAIVLLPGLMMNYSRRAGAGTRTPVGRARAGGPIGKGHQRKEKRVMSSRPTARASIRPAAGVSEARAGPAAHSAAEIADELSAWAVGGAIITAALFPLALPILALTAVAVLPFVLVPLAVALAALLVALPALTVRSLVRRAGQAPAPAQRGG